MEPNAQMSRNALHGLTPTYCLHGYVELARTEAASRSTARPSKDTTNNGMQSERVSQYRPLASSSEPRKQYLLSENNALIIACKSLWCTSPNAGRWCSAVYNFVRHEAKFETAASQESNTSALVVTGLNNVWRLDRGTPQGLRTFGCYGNGVPARSGSSPCTLPGRVLSYGQET